MPQARNYVLQVLLFTGSLLTLTAGFNELTDPYGIYGTFCRMGANQQKPGQKGHDRLVKAYTIRHLMPDAITLGTSRVQYGIDPTDAALKRLAKRPYNGALLGSNIYLALRYLQHAEAVGHVRLAVLGLDPLMFDDTNQDALRDFSEQRMAVDALYAPQPYGTVTDIPSTLLSMDATRLSVRTWRQQGSIVTDLTDLGQRSPAALARLYPSGVSMMDRFLAVDAEYAKNYKAMRWPQSAQTSPSLQAFAHLVDFAIDHQIRLEIYLTPEHVHLHEVAAMTGHTKDIDRLTTLITETVQIAQHRVTLPKALTLWQFSTINSVTQEAVPGPLGTTNLQWFWEPTHAKDALGHLILGRMLDEAPSALSKDAGSPIDMTNVGHMLAQKNAALKRWETSHADEVAAIGAKLAHIGIAPAL